MTTIHSRISIPVNKQARRKVHPSKWWPICYSKFEDIPEHESMDDGKQELLGLDINEESSVITNNIDDSSVLNSKVLRVTDDNAKVGELNDKKENEMDGEGEKEEVLLEANSKKEEHRAILSSCSTDMEENQEHEEEMKKNEESDRYEHDEEYENEVDQEEEVDKEHDYNKRLERSPSFKIYVRQSDDIDNGREELAGSGQGVKCAGNETETTIVSEPSSIANHDVGESKDYNIQCEKESNIKEKQIEKLNGQSRRKKRTVLGAWRLQREKLASLRSYILAVMMCRSLQRWNDLGCRDKRGMGKKTDCHYPSGRSLG